MDLKASWNGFEGRRVHWRAAKPVDARGQIDLGRVFSNDDDRAAYGSAIFESPADRKAQMVVGSDDTLTVWLNGKKVYDFTDRRGFEHERRGSTFHSCVGRTGFSCAAATGAGAGSSRSP